MFCDEPIIKVYVGRSEDFFDDSTAFLDCYHDLAYHVPDGRRLVLETEHHYISIGVNGVSLECKTKTIIEFEEPGEWLYDCVQVDEDPNEPPYVYYEHTLFFGERLLEVTRIEDGFSLKFDDFSMKLIPHKSSDEIEQLRVENFVQEFVHVYGLERLLKKPCQCGGSGELFMDFVYDCFVRCNKCKKATWVQQTAEEAIDEWNCGELSWDASEITIE